MNFALKCVQRTSKIEVNVENFEFVTNISSNYYFELLKHVKSQGGSNSRDTFSWENQIETEIFNLLWF